MKHLLVIILLLSTGLTSGCDHDKRLNRGFSLPKGDVQLGQSIFIEKRCIECHSMAAAEFAGPDWQLDQTRAINVVIGGRVTKLKTYGDLVTSIINPSHRIAKTYAADQMELANQDGESKMPNYNDVMTVTELVHLVAFLQPQYELVSPPVTTYPLLHMP